MVFANTNPFPNMVTPLSNISPFTYADGITYLEKLEQMRVWLNASLVPEFNTTIDNVIIEFQTGFTTYEAAHQVIYDAFVANATSIVNATNNRVGPASIVRLTLTGPTSLTVDPTWPTAHPVFVTVTQDATGSRVLTLGAGITGTVVLASAPGSRADFLLMPDGAGNWLVVQPATRASVDALKVTVDANTASNATLSQTLATLASNTTASLALKLDKTEAATTYLNLADATTRYYLKADVDAYRLALHNGRTIRYPTSGLAAPMLLDGDSLWRDVSAQACTLRGQKCTVRFFANFSNQDSGLNRTTVWRIAWGTATDWTLNQPTVVWVGQADAPYRLGDNPRIVVAFQRDTTPSAGEKIFKLQAYSTALNSVQVVDAVLEVIEWAD